VLLQTHLEQIESVVLRLLNQNSETPDQEGAAISGGEIAAEKDDASRRRMRVEGIKRPVVNRHARGRTEIRDG